MIVESYVVRDEGKGVVIIEFKCSPDSKPADVGYWVDDDMFDDDLMGGYEYRGHIFTIYGEKTDDSTDVRIHLDHNAYYSTSCYLDNNNIIACVLIARQLKPNRAKLKGVILS